MSSGGAPFAQMFAIVIIVNSLLNGFAPPPNICAFIFSSHASGSLSSLSAPIFAFVIFVKTSSSASALSSSTLLPSTALFTWRYTHSFVFLLKKANQRGFSLLLCIKSKLPLPTVQPLASATPSIHLSVLCPSIIA